MGAKNGKRGDEKLDGLLTNEWTDLAVRSIEWMEDGEDFEVAVLDGRWVARIARGNAGVWRLRRETRLLACLTGAPVELPRYNRQAHGAGLYGYIAGTPLSRLGTPPVQVLHELAHFIDWLHRATEPRSWRDPRATWPRRLARFYHKIRVSGLTLFSARDAREIEGQFARVLTLLDTRPWHPVLLHGDLSMDHVIVAQGHLAGIIDFGDWRWGDEAFDWCAIPGLEKLLPDSDLHKRLRLYRLMPLFGDIERGLAGGQVEFVERNVRLVRRRLLE